MPTRRSRGDGGLHWDAERQRWRATANLGFHPDGRRIVRKASGRTKTEAKARLKELLRDHDDGLPVGPGDYTVKEAIEDWLKHGLRDPDGLTHKTCNHLCQTHIIPALGARKLRELSAEDVDRWLANKTRTLSSRTLQALHSCLNRSVKRAVARDKVKRNVVALCSVPRGTDGRPSKSLTLAQAEAVLDVSRASRMHAYIVVSLLTGARTEELRALQWTEVQLETVDRIPPHIAVWRSVRRTGDTKTKKSRRTLALPQRCIDALLAHRPQQDRERLIAGDAWQEHGLVFASKPLCGPPARPSRLRCRLQGLEGGDPSRTPPQGPPPGAWSLLLPPGAPRGGTSSGSRTAAPPPPGASTA